MRSRLRFWLAFLFSMAGGVAASDEAKPIGMFDGLVCRVNREAISKRDVEARMGEVGGLLLERRRQWEASGQWNADTERRWNEEYIPEFRAALRQVVRDRLMLQQARIEKLAVDQKELDKKVRRARERLQQENPLQAHIFSTAEIQHVIRDDMLLDTFRYRFCDALEQPSRPEVEKYYKENLGKFQRPAGVMVRLIRIDRFVTNNLTSPPTKQLRENAYETAEELRKDVELYGGNFQELATKHSDDAESRARGGLIAMPNSADKYLDPKTYSPQLADALRGLEPNQVSKVFEFGQSWAIAQVVARREAGPAPLAGEMYEKIFNQLLNLKSRVKEDEWFRKTLAKALIETVTEGVSKPLPLEFFFPDDKPQPKDGGAAQAK
jgi:parvulin-like peptidyl-prolyl isomerase